MHRLLIWPQEQNFPKNILFIQINHLSCVPLNCIQLTLFFQLYLYKDIFVIHYVYNGIRYWHVVNALNTHTYIQQKLNKRHERVYLRMINDYVHDV